jgi:hypothetical protein
MMNPETSARPRAVQSEKRLKMHGRSSAHPQPKYPRSRRERASRTSRPQPPRALTLDERRNRIRPFPRFLFVVMTTRRKEEIR